MPRCIGKGYRHEVIVCLAAMLIIGNPETIIAEGDISIRTRTRPLGDRGRGKQQGRSSWRSP